MGQNEPMSTPWPTIQHEAVSWEMFLDIDEEVRRDLEIVDGYVVPREQRSRHHQKIATRLSIGLEQAAATRMRGQGGAECYETNTEVEVLLWEIPATARRPDAVLHRCIGEYEQLAARHVLVVLEVISTHSTRRDRVYKMADYAEAGIPHYWLVDFDKVGAASIERYALVGGDRAYVRIGTTHRDMGPNAVDVSAPFPIRIDWTDLEIAPQP